MEIDPTRKAPLRIAIVDDEKWARKRLEQLVAEHPGADVVAMAAAGVSAVEAIVRERPDVVFLDVQMPEMDGFEVLRQVRAVGPLDPVVVFVTAYDAHAVRAFDAHALDYLLKPFTDRRFEETLRRAAEHLRRQQLAEHHARVEAVVGTAEVSATQGRLVYKDGTHYGLLDLDELEWLEAQDVYVCLHTAEGDLLVREPLYSLADRIDDPRFVRVHRSAVVNADYVVRVVPGRQGRATLHLRGGTEVPVSRTYREGVMAVLNDGLGA